MSLNAQKQQMIVGVVRAMPEKALRSLDMALGLTRDEALREVAGMVTGEIDRRYLREMVFLPFMPLFSPRADGLDSLVFPTWILDQLWNVLEAREPQPCEDARRCLRGLSVTDATPVPFFHLVSAAAQLCQHEPEVVLQGRAAADDREQVVLFGRYLCLHRLMRKLMHHLTDFLVRMDADRQMTLRLMFRDAHDVTENGAQLFTELLFANLNDTDDMLRLAVAVSNNHNDRFLAESEMGFVGERLLKAMESSVARVRQQGGSRGQPCENLNALGQEIISILSLMQAFDHHIELSAEGPWGARMSAAHKHVAHTIDIQFKEAEGVLDPLLPTSSQRVYGTMKRETPDISQLPEAYRLQRALQLFRFVDAMRPVAARGGFSTRHSQLVQSLEARLEPYFEALLTLAHSDAIAEPEEIGKLGQWLHAMADLIQALCGEGRGHLAHRRIASSFWGAHGMSA